MLYKLNQKINIEFLKLHFNNQSQIKVNNYNINLNSREILKNNIKLKLTEKEINTINYLFKFSLDIIHKNARFDFSNTSKI